MSNDYAINFNYNNENYSIRLAPGQQSGTSLNLGGIHYSVLADNRQMAGIADVFRQLPAVPLLSEHDLAEKLSVLQGVSSVSVTSRVNAAGTSTLSRSPVLPTKVPGAWFKEENQTVGGVRKAVAEKYCEMHGNKDNHDGLIGFLRNNLIEPERKALVDEFADALRRKDRQKFIFLFDHLPLNQVREIEAGEGLDLLPKREFAKGKVITEADIHELESYMRDIGFSGACQLTSQGTSHTAAPAQADLNAPYAMHSVGKAFTGMLLMILIQKGRMSEDMIDKPIQLEQHVIDQLPKEVQQHLSHTTLRQAMQHTSGFGDYLANYQDAIRLALDRGLPPPEIRNPEDLLQYAEKAYTPLVEGQTLYSNLGSLLFGLSIQYHYNKNRPAGTEYTPYAAILREHIIAPARLSSFSETRPSNAHYDKNAEDAYLYGGPAGGYWMSVKDLDKFGQWVSQLYQQGQADSTTKTVTPLVQLLDRYGGEFYNNGVLEHNGAVPTASARLSILLNHGVSVAVLSDKGRLNGEFAADKMYFKILEKLLTREV